MYRDLWSSPLISVGRHLVLIPEPSTKYFKALRINAYADGSGISSGAEWKGMKALKQYNQKLSQLINVGLKLNN